MSPIVTQEHALGILCVDDNPRVAEALKTKFSRLGFAWRGWMESAADLAERAPGMAPVVVVLDLDMPGPSPLEALAAFDADSEVKAVIFSGHVRKDLIGRALDAGAWGYVSKNDGEEALVEAVRLVAAGELAMSPEARDTWAT